MACFVKREIIARDMIKVPWWTYMNKFALKLFKVKEEKIILICFSKYTCQCFGIFFFLKGCYFKASILYLITYLKRGKFNWNSPAQPVIVLNLIELPLSYHLHGFSWSFRRILNGVRQPKSMSRSTTDLQAEIPALVTPPYQSDWKLQEDTQYYQTLSDCVNTTDKKKPYWNNIWIYGAFYMEKNTHFAKVILPPHWISLCYQGMNYFSRSAMPSSTSSTTEVFETGPFPLLSQRGRLSKQSAY